MTVCRYAFTFEILILLNKNENEANLSSFSIPSTQNTFDNSLFLTVNALKLLKYTTLYYKDLSSKFAVFNNSVYTLSTRDKDLAFALLSIINWIKSTYSRIYKYMLKVPKLDDQQNFLHYKVGVDWLLEQGSNLVIYF